MTVGRTIALDYLVMHCPTYKRSRARLCSGAVVALILINGKLVSVLEAVTCNFTYGFLAILTLLVVHCGSAGLRAADRHV